jgi:hypothetical protein
MDTYYIENWSLWLDIKIIFMTTFKILMFSHLKILITLIAINQLLIGSNVVSPSDPSYFFLKQNFRTSHDLSLYIRPYPYTLLEFEAIDSYDNNIFTSKQAVVGVNPGLRMWNDIPITTLNVWVAGSWENLSLLAEPAIVNDPYGLDLLGTDYVRSGIRGRITNAFIRYKNELISLQLGRSPVWWGQSWNHSIIQTGSGPTYDHLDLHLNFGSFQLEMLAGQLGSEFLYGVRIKRNIAGHRLTWLSKGGMLLAGFGEQIIYTGKNRGMEWHYLNPFVPYFFSALEGDDESVNNDNSILFATIRYVPKPYLSFFGELIIDDYQVDDNNVQDALGYKIGADGSFDILGKPITWVMEWTSINSWTYIHIGQFSSWQNRGHALGFPYGPDLKSLHIQGDMWVSKSLLFNMEANWLEKGSNTLSTPWENSDNKDDPFPKPPVTDHALLVTSLNWFWKYARLPDWQGILEAGWSNYDFPNKIAFSDPESKTEGSLFLKAQFYYDFGFNLQ